MTIETALVQLAGILGERLSRGKSDLANHGRSETHFPTTPPDAVAYPTSTQEVSQIVKICATESCPVVAWGTGTSLEGHSLAVNGGVCVDFSLMNKVLAVNDADMDVRVQPGLTRQELNEHLRATGLFFSVDPGANAALGGMAGTRASGTTAVRYGTMRDNVLALEVVLADGRIIRTGSRARKSSSGYDMTGLFVGSEGTLGLITELTLRLHGQPEATSSGVCSFPSMEEAVACVIATVQMGIPMARIEFVDGATAEAFNSYAGANYPTAPHLMVEFHGSDASVAEDSARFGELVKDFDGSDFEWSTKQEERAALWTMRHNAHYAVCSTRPGTDAWVTDVCVPISNLARAVSETQADIAQSSITGPILGHVGDGNFHAILLIEKGNEVEMAEARAIAARMNRRAIELQGTISGEHGVGLGKLGYMADEHGEAWAVMGDIKRALDPKNIFNPGKMVRLN